MPARSFCPLSAVVSAMRALRIIASVVDAQVVVSTLRLLLSRYRVTRADAASRASPGLFEWPSACVVRLGISRLRPFAALAIAGGVSRQSLVVGHVIYFAGRVVASLDCAAWKRRARASLRVPNPM